MNRGHVGHYGAVESVFLLGPFGRRTVQHEGVESRIFIGHRLHEILHALYRNIALKIETNVVGVRIYSRFAPAVFDDATGFHSGHRERTCFEFQAARSDDGAIEDVFLLELDDGAVGLDGPGCDVANLESSTAATSRLATSPSGLMVRAAMSLILTSLP